MSERTLKTAAGDSRIIVGDGALERLHEYTDPSASVLFVDQAVHEQVAALLPAWRIAATLGGEHCKSLEHAEELYRSLLELNADRDTTIVTIGGGALLDLGGFVAATYMRGVRCVFVPTTLLAQVDASIGGKNGVNYGSFKNLVGTIRQPDVVICDTNFLLKLPQEEFLSGLAEVVKHGAIADAELVSILESSSTSVSERDPVLLRIMVDRSHSVKQAIVERDPLESNLRRLLNFGHTVAHGIEHATAMKHGLAVAVGMAVTAELSVRTKKLAAKESTRLRELLQTLGFSLAIPCPIDQIMAGIARDKKRSSSVLHSVLLTSLGSAVIEPLTLDSWKVALEHYQQREGRGQ